MLDSTCSDSIYDLEARCHLFSVGVLAEPIDRHPVIVVSNENTLARVIGSCGSPGQPVGGVLDLSTILRTMLVQQAITVFFNFRVNKR